MSSFSAESLLSPTAPSVRRIMAMTLLALLPGAVAATFVLGAGVLVQISLAALLAVSLEALMLKLRRQPMAPFLTDFSAPLTAALFALCVPPSAPLRIAAVGMVVAIVVAKHLFGGLGRNLFNPAMAGLAVARLCFPEAFAHGHARGYDGFTVVGSSPWPAILFALGGFFLLWRKIISWQIPAATLAAAIVATLVLWVVFPGDNSLVAQTNSSMALVLAAFFIATDPVTGCTTARGRLVFGAGVGGLAVLIGLRDNNGITGMAFAVLLMNCAAPLLDRLTQAKIHRGTTP